MLVYCVKDKVVGTLEVNQCEFVEHLVLWWSQHLFFTSKAAKKDYTGMKLDLLWLQSLCEDDKQVYTPTK